MRRSQSGVNEWPRRRENCGVVDDKRKEAAEVTSSADFSSLAIFLRGDVVGFVRSKRRYCE